ncbi:MAG: glycosyltransferase family 2 protein, partial [Planctomycetota bacterium]
MPEANQPFVSVIMPIRNEVDFIARGIRSILDNDYPGDKLEIIVVDGCSDDGTQELVEKIAEKDSRVTLLTNPAKIVPTALNLGLKAAKGEIFIRIDGHAEVPADFIKNSVRCLAEHPDAWVAGGYIET